jgi:hypothetical protein
MNDIVYVTNMMESIVGFSLPERHYSKTWLKKGARLPIEKDILREAIYLPGVEYLFRQGILFMDDMPFKIELGLEQPEATAETAEILRLDDKLAARIIKTMPIAEAKATLEKLSATQKEEIFVYAVNHAEDLDMSRIKMIEKVCNINLLKAIENKQAMEE